MRSPALDASAASTATLAPADTKDKEKDSTTKSSSSLIGKINNLISSDLDNIVEGRELFYLIFYAPLKVALSIWFLYVVLGWRYVLFLADYVSEGDGHLRLMELDGWIVVRSSAVRCC